MDCPGKDVGAQGLTGSMVQLDCADTSVLICNAIVMFGRIKNLDSGMDGFTNLDRSGFTNVSLDFQKGFY